MLSMQVHVRALCEWLIPGVGCVKHASACVCVVCAVVPGVCHGEDVDQGRQLVFEGVSDGRPAPRGSRYRLPSVQTLQSNT